ncbi:MAG: isochorismate synthase, partial [Flavobacteriaceae bacterium]|nr:isochorismate synthase [Flavobacteriaceae bacterium]
ENYNREFYTGYLGELNIKEQSHLFVNLRCMQIKNTKAFIYVGGGITLESNPEKEWVETVTKSEVMKLVLK